MKTKPGYEPIVQAFSGIFSVNGAPDTPPPRVGFAALDMGSGMWTAMGCLAALYRREMTGEGCTVDTSLFETALGWLAINFCAYKTFGTLPTRHRTGSPRRSGRDQATAPQLLRQRADQRDRRGVRAARP